MADYLVGDVQGCFTNLEKLLKQLKFSADKDHLFLLGDVVNRGPESLKTLRFIKDNPDTVSMILGNHDFHLLACAFGDRTPGSKDTFVDILQAPDRLELLDFIRQQPLLIEHKGALLVHAGIPPIWDKRTALENAALVEAELRLDDISDFLQAIYEDQPNYWSTEHNQIDTCRYTVNALLRMRFCTRDSELEFKHKANFDQAPEGYQAWFMHDNRQLSDTDIFFGHWSALGGIEIPHIYPMDQGCVWGRSLGAIRLEDKQQFSVKC